MTSISIPVGVPRCPSETIATDALAREMLPILTQLANEHPEAHLPTNPTKIVWQLNHEINQPGDKSPDPWHSISRSEAGNYILAKLGQQRQKPLSLWEAAVSAELNHDFYSDETEWLYDPKAPQQRTPATITKVDDGDTDVATVKEGPTCPDLTETLRFAGIDTPESFVSQKLYRVMGDVAANLGVSNDFLGLIETRIRYMGNLAKIVNHDFTDWVQGQGDHFSLGWNYIFNTNGNDAQLWGLMEPFDKYGRRVATIYVDRKDLIERYFRERLPIVMKTAGEQLYLQTAAAYQSAFVQMIKTHPLQGKALAALSPDTMIDPAKTFSASNSARLAADWQSIAGSLGRTDDWTLAEVAMGMAYHYRKYDNQNREAYATIQAMAKKNNTGLWVDPIFFYMDPDIAPSQQRPANLVA